MQLRPYQYDAVEHLWSLYADGHARATCVLPCGTGKTVVARALTQNASSVLVLVPTVALLAQTLTMFTARPEETVVAVCSSRTLGEHGDDVTPDDIGLEVTTDPERLRPQLGERVVVVGTYASLGVVAAATEAAGHTWEFVVCDEAHRVAGAAGKTWARVLDERVLPARRRLFLTATPRQVHSGVEDEAGRPAPVASMTDPELFGPIYQPLSLRQAIDDGYLSDYRVAVVAVTQDEVARSLAAHYRSRAAADIDAGSAAAKIALLRYAGEQPHLRSVIAFHNTIAASQRWTGQWASSASTLPVKVRSSCTHIDGGSPALERQATLGALAEVPPGHLRVVSNCRVLSEGVDVPSLDAVLFAQPRTSAPDIVQIVGRALRLHPAHAHRALVIIPVLVDDRSGVEESVAGTPFLAAWQVLTALAHEDTSLYDAVARRAALSSRELRQNPDPVDDLLDVDVSALTPKLAAAFRLRVLRRTTSTWTVCVTKLVDDLNRGGSIYPRRGYTPGGYPLGERVAGLRQAHANGQLHPSLVAYVERTVPGWSWEPRPAGAAGRTFEEWVELLAGHLAKTGVNVVRPYETTTGPDGDKANLGAWLARQQRRRSRLSVEQVDRLTELLGPTWVRPR